VLVFPIRKNLWLFSYDRCKFFVNNLEDGLGYLAPFEPYERYFKIRAGDVVVDVGACVEGFAIPAARKCGKRGIVIAIEPDPENVKKLRENIYLNRLNNIIVVPKAAWNRKEMVTFFHGKSIDSHTLIPNVKVGSRTITSSSGKSEIVLADTLSSIVSDLRIEKINFLKIDVEGAELEVLEGSRDILANIEKVVVAAYHIRNGKRTLPWVYQFMKRHGFQVRAEPNGLVYALRAKKW
jgi:FkbM family methyltransferase